jgi:hypothetical protein
VAALTANAADIRVPAGIEATGHTLAGAAIPAMLIVLGLQVQHGLPRLAELRDVAGTPRPTALRSPLVVLSTLASVVTLTGLITLMR